MKKRKERNDATSIEKVKGIKAKVKSPQNQGKERVQPTAVMMKKILSHQHPKEGIDGGTEKAVI